MSYLQEAMYHKMNGDDDRALVYLELASMHSGVINKNSYIKRYLSPQTKWTKRALLEGCIPGVMFPAKLRMNFMQWLGVDIDTYNLTDEEKTLINNL
jgi:hypothetical protein